MRRRTARRENSQCKALKLVIFEKDKETSVAGTKNGNRKNRLEVTKIILPLEGLWWFRLVS